MISAKELIEAINEVTAAVTNSQQSWRDTWLCSEFLELNSRTGEELKRGIEEGISPAAFVTSWFPRKHAAEVRPVFLRYLKMEIENYQDDRGEVQLPLTPITREALYMTVRHFIRLDKEGGN